jgi:hypothetical protein
METEKNLWKPKSEQAIFRASLWLTVGLHSPSIRRITFTNDAAISK